MAALDLARRRRRRLPLAAGRPAGLPADRPASIDYRTQARQQRLLPLKCTSLVATAAALEFSHFGEGLQQKR